MTLQSRLQPIAIPLSALLPPQAEAGPSRHTYFPSPAGALLGPLPSTSPFHLALSFLQLQDIPEYEHELLDDAPLESSKKGKATSEAPRVLIIATSKDAMYKALEEEDEAWMRNHGGAYSVVERLKRVDVRFCPTVGHLKLLLSLLSVDPSSSGKDPQVLGRAPSIVILWDAASLLMEEVENNNENQAPDEEGGREERDVEMREEGAGEVPIPPIDDEGPRTRFKNTTTISSYLDLISSLRSAVEHLSSLNTSSPPTQLIILEPRLQPDATLPIMPLQPNPATPSSTRSKRVALADGLRWLFGPDSVGLISPDTDVELPPGETRYCLLWTDGGDGETRLGMARIPCEKSPHVGPIRLDAEGNPEIWAWQWSWTS